MREHKRAELQDIGIDGCFLTGRRGKTPPPFVQGGDHTDRYVYIDFVEGDTDKENPAVIRFTAVAFGRGAKAEIFDRPCRPVRPLGIFAEKLIGVSNKDLEKYPPQDAVKDELIRFVGYAHAICRDTTLCEKVLGKKPSDVRTLADVRRAGGTAYFDERHAAVLEAAKHGALSLADVQRITESAFPDACDIADDLIFHGSLAKEGRFYVLADRGRQP